MEDSCCPVAGAFVIVFNIFYAGLRKQLECKESFEIFFYARNFHLFVIYISASVQSFSLPNSSDPNGRTSMKICICNPCTKNFALQLFETGMPKACFFVNILHGLDRPGQKSQRYTHNSKVLASEVSAVIATIAIVTPTPPPSQRFNSLLF